MKKNNRTERQGHQHRGKFTEDLLNSEAILKALNIKAGQTILDAGCGNGYMSKVFSDEVSQSGKVVALDPDKYFIEILKNETKGTNIQDNSTNQTQTIICRSYLYINSDPWIFSTTDAGLYTGGNVPS